jgi:hypothetical protein
MKQLEQLLKNNWDAYLETLEGTDIAIAYKGDGAVRNVMGSKASFDVIYNPLRDQRRGGSASGSNVPPMPSRPEDCNLCTNVLSKHAVLEKRGDYVVAPNGWPINRYHTLLILDEKCPKSARQGELYAFDLGQAMNFSKDTGQLVIYNTFGAAATQWHQHFQGFSYDSPINRLKTIPMSVDGLIHTMPDYPGMNFVFYGDKLGQATELINRVRNLPSEYTYTLLFNENKLTVIPRRKAGEAPDCTQKKIGGFECSMVYVVGNRYDEDKVIESGQEVFFRLGYNDLSKALKNATVPRAVFTDWFKPHPIYEKKFPAKLETAQVGG